MKRILSSMIIILLCTSMFSMFMPHVNAQETVIFQDDFESYAVGSFPSAGGWEIVWNGAGNQYQVITSSYYASPTRSLQLMGSYGWSVVVKKDFSTNASLIGYEASLMSTNIAGGGGISFFNRPIATWGRFYAGVGFLDGYIGSGSVQFQPFTPYTWYKVRVILDKITRKYDVWIDDVLVGKDLVEPNDPNEILSLHVGVGWKQIAHYFDDVKVFSVSSNFDASITPSEMTTSIDGTVSYDVTIRNYQETSNNFTLDIIGLDSSWFSLERKNVYLAPGEVANVRLDVTVPENPLVVGTYPFSVTVFYDSIQKILEANLSVVLNPTMFELEPQTETTIGSTSILISWKTSSSASSEVYVKRVDESTFTRWDGERGLNHFVHIYNLSRNTDYLWYVHSATLYGNVTSAIRTLHVANGLSFTQDVYTFSVERDYAQRAGISVINTDVQSHDLLLQITNPYDDLIVGFVGAGSVDQTVSVSPNEARLADLYIHAQDAKLSAYSLKINLTNLGVEEIVDYAVVNVNVRQPNINLEVLEVSMDNATLTKTYTVINHGDTVTDLQVLPGGPLKTQVQVDPNINHALLRTGESLSFKAVPVLTQDFTGYDGNIQVVAAGESQNVAYNVVLPPGEQVFVITKENGTWTVKFNDWYCTNRPRIDERFTLPSYIKKTVDGKPNVDQAAVESFFSLPSPRDSYRPHNVHIFMNGIEIGSLINTIPEGYKLFSFQGNLLNYASEGLAENVLTLQMDNLNGGHYVISADMEIVLHVRRIEIAVVATNETEANALADKLGGTIANFADFGVYPEGITISNPQPKEGEAITITAEIVNFGTLGGTNVPVSFYLDSTLVETKTLSSMPSLSSQAVSFVWTTTKGTHTITIKVNEAQTIQESDYANNQASASITVASIPQDIEAYLVDPAWGMNNYEVEKGGAITPYFTVNSRNSNKELARANGVQIRILSSIDSSARTNTSGSFNGRDGIIQAGPYDTSSFSGTEFHVKVVEETFYGLQVIGPGFDLVYTVKQRTSTTGAGFENSISAALGVGGLEGKLQEGFLIKNDGAKALDVTVARKAEMGLGFDFPAEFKETVGSVTVNAGIESKLIAGILGGLDYHCPNPSDSNQASLVRYLVTLCILDQAEAQCPASSFAIEALKSLVKNEISKLGVASYYSPLTVGGWFKGSTSIEAGLKIGTSQGTFSTRADQFVQLGGGIAYWFKTSSQVNVYTDEIGLRFSILMGGSANFNFGFAVVAGFGQDTTLEIAEELKFDKTSKSLKSVELEFIAEVTQETYSKADFGGLLERVEAAKFVLSPGKKYKMTTVYKIPVANSGTLYDFLIKVGLYTLSPSMGTADLFEFSQKIYDSMKQGSDIDYSITMEEENTASVRIELAIPGVKLGFDLGYVESQSFLAECGHVTFTDGNSRFWPTTMYASAPQSLNARDFILNNLVSGLIPKIQLTGTVVQMKETRSRLYLHVYDPDGNHVGFNYDHNTTDLNIPGSAYYDNSFGKTEIVLPSNISHFTVTVDGAYAHFVQENFTLRIHRFGSENYTTFQFVDQEIEKGTSRSYLATVLENDTVIANEIIKLSVSISPLSASIHPGQSVTFTSTVSGGQPPYGYQWYLDGAPVSGATTSTWVFTPTTSGIYYVYLKVTDDNNNVAQSETARITVSTVPVGGYSFPIQVSTRAEPIIPYIALIAALTAVFTKLRPKTKRKR